MISLNNITVTFSGKDLFKDISFQINKENKVGLVGKNGTGKSTLLKIITGELKDFSGSLSIPKQTTIGYLPQYLIYNDGKTIFEEAFRAFDEYKAQLKKLKNYNSELTERTDYESVDYHKLINKISELSYRLSFQNENHFIAQTEKILKGLGFSDTDFTRQTSEFSGGWRMRVEIAKILLKQPEVLLLDEPTNHLDINSIQWLESFLKSFGGAVVVISHDKRFLDNITNRTIEIIHGGIYDYPVPYSKYKILSKERLEQQIAAYENQQNKIKQTEKFIERFRAKATKASQVQSRIKMLDKIDVIEIDPEDNTSINFIFPPAPRAGDIVLETEGLSKNYGDLNVLKNIDFSLERGEKIAFVGKNGEGKTTFARVIVKELDYDGHLKIGHNVTIGYYAQNQDETLDKERTVFETLDDVATGDVRTQLRKILGSFLFRNDDIDKKVSVLSGGERARLAIAKLILQPYSLLILDEPTNHLDISAKEILKQALLKYDGTLIVVSHDRDFLDGLVNTVYEFSGKKIKQFKGNIDYFLEKKKIEYIDDLSINTEKSEKQEKNTSENKADYLKRKEQKRQESKIQRQIDNIEKEIDSLENNIAEAEKIFANPINTDTAKLFEEYEKNKKSLEIKMKKWEILHSELSDIQKT